VRQGQEDHLRRFAISSALVSLKRKVLRADGGEAGEGLRGRLAAYCRDVTAANSACGCDRRMRNQFLAGKPEAPMMAVFFFMFTVRSPQSVAFGLSRVSYGLLTTDNGR